MAYDLETYTEGNEISSARNGDKVLIIGCFCRIKGQARRVAFVWGPPVLAHPDIEIYHCQNEREALLNFGNFVADIEPEIVVGFNNHFFDDVYVFERARLLLSPQEL